MNINFNTQHAAVTLCEMADPNTKRFLSHNNISEIDMALYHLKAMAENEYNMEYWRTLVTVLSAICEFDYLEC